MTYTVVGEFLILRDNTVLHVSDVGSVVELSDLEAAELLRSGKVARPDVDPGPNTVEDKPRRSRKDTSES